MSFLSSILFCVSGQCRSTKCQFFSTAFSHLTYTSCIINWKVSAFERKCLNVTSINIITAATKKISATKKMYPDQCWNKNWNEKKVRELSTRMFLFYAFLAETFPFSTHKRFLLIHIKCLSPFAFIERVFPSYFLKVCCHFLFSAVW